MMRGSQSLPEPVAATAQQGEPFVPRFVPGALIAVVVVVALMTLPRTALGVEPLLTDVMAAGETFGMDCEQFGETASCIADDGDRFRDTYIYDLEPGFQITAGRNRFDATEVAPVEADLMEYFHTLVTLAVGDDPAAHAWLDSMNEGPVASDTYEVDGWKITWGTTLVTVSEPPVPNVSLDLFYLPAAPDGSAEPATNAAWSAGGASTYTGTWTLVSYETESDLLADEAVGDQVPGTVEIDCTFGGDVCGYTLTRQGTDWWTTSIDVAEPGRLHRTDQEELDNCTDGQLRRTTHDAAYGPSEATASVEQVTVPRTCEDGAGTLYAADSTWTFEGTLTEFRAPPAADLEAYLLDYGFTCADADAEGSTRCTLEVQDEDGLDATYTVLTRHDGAGDVVGVDASALSLDDSMPSDTGGFLRSVAELSPVDDVGSLLSWFDAALSGGSSEHTAGSWTAAWTDAPDGDGRRWTLSLVDGDAAPSPAATEAGAPVAPGTPIPEGPATPAVGHPFAESVPTVAEVSTDPVVLLQSAALAGLLVFLMPFPSQLFNSTLETHEEEVKRWLGLDRLGAAAGRLGDFWGSWAGVLTFTMLATLLFSFLDPTFGLSLGSLATFTGMLAGIVLVTGAFAIPALLAHRRIGDSPALKVVPISLLIGVACVLLSRLTDFQPGYLYGLLIGIAFARELSAADEGRVTALGAVLMLIVAFGAWIVLGLLPDGEAFGLVVARTSLAALMVAGLEGVVFGLLPMRFLPGEPLYAWNRVLWGTLLAIGAFAFFHVLINPASGYLSDTSRTPLLTVIALLVGFTLVSVGVWAWFRFRAEPVEASA